MTKIQKIILILLNVVFFFYIVVVSLSLYPIMALPMDLQFFSQLILKNTLLLQLVFWMSMAMGIISIIIFLYLILYPRRESKFVVPGTNGSLTIDKSAIEALTKASLDEKNFIDSPRVKVSAIRKKLHISVIGELKRTSHLINQEEAWKNHLRNDIRRLLGEEKDIKIDIDLFNFYKGSNTDKRETRVI